MDHDALPRPANDVVFRELDGQMVLVHLGTNHIYALNETGARFWALLAEGKDRRAVVQQLREEFDVEGAQVEQEIEALLGDLTAAGLVG